MWLHDDGKSVYCILKPRYNEACLEGLWFKPLAWKYFCHHFATREMNKWHGGNTVAASRNGGCWPIQGFYIIWGRRLSFGEALLPSSKMTNNLFRDLYWESRILIFCPKITGGTPDFKWGGDRIRGGGGGCKASNKTQKFPGQKIDPQKIPWRISEPSNFPESIQWFNMCQSLCCSISFNILFLPSKRNSVLSELTFHHFKYDFKTMTFRSQKTLQRWKFIQLGKVIDLSRTLIPLKPLMIPLKRMKLRGSVGEPVFKHNRCTPAFTTKNVVWGRSYIITS